MGGRCAGKAPWPSEVVRRSHAQFLRAQWGQIYPASSFVPCHLKTCDTHWLIFTPSAWDRGVLHPAGWKGNLRVRGEAVYSPAVAGLGVLTAALSRNRRGVRSPEESSLLEVGLLCLWKRNSLSTADAPYGVCQELRLAYSLHCFSRTLSQKETIWEKATLCYIKNNFFQ